MSWAKTGSKHRLVQDTLQLDHIQKYIISNHLKEIKQGNNLPAFTGR